MSSQPSGSEPWSGLTQAQALQQLAADGPNEIGPAQQSSWGRRLLGLLAEPMFALLLGAVLVYLILGDLGEGLTLGVFVLAVLALTLLQEGRADRSIDALRRLSEPKVRVIRDGLARELPARELVCGDLVLLAEGRRVAADGLLLRADSLEVDESLLTGESVPVPKQAGAEGKAARVYAGTHVVRGQALMRVSATGGRTEFGRIGLSLQSLPELPTPLQKQTARLVRVLAVVALLLCAAMVLLQGWRTGQWLPALLVGIASAMAMLPEEYPVVLAIFPALGAYRLAREGVLVRRIQAIEALGATTVLCADKTGTITQNRMSVQALAVEQGGRLQWLRCDAAGLWPSPGAEPAFYRVAEHAILASASDPHDPMEQAFHRMGRDWLGGTGRLHQWDLVRSYPLSPQLRALSQAWRVDEEQAHVVSAKGAPEAVMELCHLPADQRLRWQSAVEQMAAEGLRVLAVARGAHPQDKHWPDSAHGFDFEWIGLIGLADPVRPQVQPAMAQCFRAGIRVIMITGDHPVTARAIALQAGMPVREVLTGEQIDALDDAHLDLRLKDTPVCARISPQQKLRIVAALVRSGEIVTMTGDGVNDAPALRAAHVGVAMGERGTDVAREAASVVLVDDDFASIVRGIRAGRRIFINLRRSMGYIFAVHIPIAGMAVLPVVLALPPVLLPLHIALIELMVDPACSLAFENQAEEADAMERPPRDTRAPLFGASEMGQAALQGLLLLAGMTLAYALSVQSDAMAAVPSIERTRAMVMLAFVAGNAALVMVSLPGSMGPAAPFKQPVVWVVLGLAMAAVLLAIYWPALASALKLQALDALSAGLAALAGVSGLLLGQAVRWAGRRLRA